MNDINEIKRKRFLFLKTVYNESNGNVNTCFQMHAVGKLIGIAQKEVHNIAHYLVEEKLLTFSGFGGEISITHQGVIEVENALSNPDEQTKHFPPINFISIHHMENSQIQQGNIESNLVVNLSYENKSKIKEFLSLLQQKKNDLELSTDDDSEMKAEISTIEAQLESSKPKRNIIKESLSTLKTILERASGAVVASELLKYIPALTNLL